MAFCHTAHWTVTRVDGDYSASSYGSCALTKPESLTSRTDLKTADIIADVKAVLGTSQVDAILNGLTLKSAKKNSYTGKFRTS